jgi:hypothetical protein
MNGSDEKIAKGDDLPVRRRHSHAFPGVDIALTEWPGIEEQRQLVNEELANVLLAKLCVAPTAQGAEVQITLDNVGAGHAFPSGAAQDRRAWVEVQASLNGGVVYESGVLSEGTALADLDDPDLWRMGDTLLDENGEQTHAFWKAVEVHSNLLPAAVTTDPTDPAFYHTVTRTYSVLGLPPDAVSMRVRIRPIGLDVLDDLIESGDLAPEIRDAMPTFDLQSTVLSWSADGGYGCVP